MTVDNPPSTVNETKGQVFKEKTNEEPTLSIQIKPPTTNENVPEEPSSPNEEKRANSKRRGLFNNPFAKHSPKKETSEDIVHANDATTREATDSEAKPPTSPHGENKIAKGLGNLYTRLKVSLLYCIVIKEITKRQNKLI
jgi:hypothetical protein